MKKIKIIIVIIIVFGCKNEKVVKKVEQQIVPLDEVVFVLKNYSTSLSLNIKSSSYQITPDLLTLSNIEGESTLVIPTDSIVKVMIGHRLYMAKGTFVKGDTVHISEKAYTQNGESIPYPYFNVTNRKVNPIEFNFDYYIGLKTPTIDLFDFYRMFSRRKKNNKIFSVNDVYNNIVNTSDSLYKKELVSKEFHEKQLQVAEIFKANANLTEAYSTKQKLQIDTLDVSMSNDFLADNNYYIQYLITTIKYRFFLNKKGKVKDSEIFNFLIKNDNLFSTELNSKLLNRLLNKIFETEKNNFEICFEKIKANSNYSSIIKKFEIILANKKKEKYLMTLLKKSTGKLLSLEGEQTVDFQEVLKKEKGKVILVDFWASWCAPCRQEMPSLRLLQKELDSTKFSVISISTDASFTAWEKASITEKLDKKPHNYLLLNSKKSELINNYKIFTIPRYLLFDFNGQLINDNAPRPSDPMLKDLIIKNVKK